MNLSKLQSLLYIAGTVLFLGMAWGSLNQRVSAIESSEPVKSIAEIKTDISDIKKDIGEIKRDVKDLTLYFGPLKSHGDGR